MEIIELSIFLRAGRHRWAAEHARLAGVARTASDADDLLFLDMHAAGKNRVGPGEFFRRGRPYVFVDQPDLPALGKIGGDDQDTLRRHERTHAVSQLVGMLERAKGRRIARENAKDAPDMADANPTLHPSKIPVMIHPASCRPGYAPWACSLAACTAILSVSSRFPKEPPNEPVVRADAAGRDRR